MGVGYRVGVLLLTVGAALSLSCRGTSLPPKSQSAPARVESVAGTDLKRVTLSQDAADRIGIRTMPLREQSVVRKRTVGAEVISVGPTLLRVKATPSDVSRVDRSGAARARLLTPRDAPAPATPAPGFNAVAVDAPPNVASPAPPALYYSVEGSSGLVLGQRVLLEIPLRGGDAQRKVVPYSAVLYDLRGDTWTYTQLAPLTFMRHRVNVDYFEKDLAILTEGPPAGTEVVVVGAAELFGTELSIGK